MSTDDAQHRTSQFAAPGAQAGPATGPAGGFAGFGASQDILAASPDEPSGRKAPWLLVAGVAALVLALIGGVTYGAAQLSGGGSQPEDALPSGAFGFLKVDLDPPAGQKVDGFRFMRKFPALREQLGDGDDLRRVVFEAVADGAGWSDVDFDAEVAPWMGRRIGVGAYPPPENSPVPVPGAVVALQVTDGGAAEKGLARLTAALPGGAAPGYVVTGDYALLAATQQLADRAAADAEDGVLASDATLAADLAAAGDGIVAAWVDLGRATESLGQAATALGGGLGVLGAPAGGATGRSTYVARFAGPDVFEVTGTATSPETAGWETSGVTGMETLPESSVVAFGLAGGDALVRSVYDSVRTAVDEAPGVAAGPSFDEMVAAAEKELGIEVPDDLAALLGDNLLVALDGSDRGSLDVGARLSTDVTRAERVLDVLEKTAKSDIPVIRERAGDDLVLATTPRQAERMAATGSLGERAGFRESLPDLGDADLALWVDVNGVVGALLDGLGDGSPDENLEPIDGVGVTVSSGGDDTTFRVRLVTH
jgi:hypothetical protein